MNPTTKDTVVKTIERRYGSWLICLAKTGVATHTADIPIGKRVTVRDGKVVEVCK